MSYINAVNIIKGVAGTVNPDGLFVHGRTWDASLEFDNLDIQIYLYPFTGSVDLNNSYFETYQITMGFYFQDAPDSTNEDRQTLIQRADNLTRDFLASLNLVEGIEVSGVRVEPSYRKMAGTYTGYILSFTLGIDTNLCGGEVEPDIPTLPTFCEKVDTCLSIPTSNGNYMLSILNGVKSWIAASASVAWGSITGKITNQTDLVNYIASQLIGYATQAWVQSQGYITNVITALGYTPENVANKATDFSTLNNTLYPTTQAVDTHIKSKGNPVFFGKFGNTSAGTTEYIALSGLATAGNVSNRASGICNNYTVARLTIYRDNGQPVTGSFEYTLYVNGVATALKVTIAAGSAPGSYTNTVNTVAVVSGDLLVVEFKNNASSASQTLGCSIEFRH